MAIPHRSRRRSARRGQFGGAGGAAGELGTGYLGGLAPGGRHCGLARHVSPLPAPPQQAGRGELTGSGEETAVKNQVRALRVQRGLAQGQLAEAMGVSRQTINSIENDRYTPSLPLAIALARYFSVPVEEMFDDQGT